MLYYDRAYASEGIDPAKRNNSKECIAYTWWFINYWFKFKISVCNGCHDWTIYVLNLAILLLSLL